MGSVRITSRIPLTVRGSLAAVVGKEYAREKNYYTAYSRNAQGVYKRIPVNVHIIYLGLAAQINALPILRLRLYATGEKPTASKIAMASLPVR